MQLLVHRLFRYLFELYEFLHPPANFPGGVVQHLLINKWWTREKPLKNRKTCLFFNK